MPSCFIYAYTSFEVPTHYNVALRYPNPIIHRVIHSPIAELMGLEQLRMRQSLLVSASWESKTNLPKTRLKWQDIDQNADEINKFKIQQRQLAHTAYLICHRTTRTKKCVTSLQNCFHICYESKLWRLQYNRNNSPWHRSHYAQDLRLVNRDLLTNPATPLDLNNEEDAKIFVASLRSSFAIAWAVIKACSDTGP